MKIKCPYIKRDKKDFVCRASASNMVPGIFEINVYCTTEEYYRCPLLIARTLRDGYREWAVRAGAILSR